MNTDALGASLADRYLIERELGQGGMATVYLAQDLKHDRKVALKVLKPELAAVLGAERFVVEIKTTAALQHPHILPLFDSGSAGQGDGGTEFLYYVMPFIDGETLRGKLDRETQLGIEESVRIASDVASALQYAHEHGVIHRDIKPENILLHDGRPMVADFGIALAVSAAAGGRMTETGLSLGTPHYMSPEQATAEKEITARSDVYSLGSVLYEMLTGEPPHMGNSAQQIIMKIIAEDAQAVTRLRKAVPANVVAAVAKSLEKLPADRFESARAFAEALVNPAFRYGGGVGAAAAGPAPWQVNRLAAVLGVALVAVGALATWLLTRPAEAPPVPEALVAFPLIDSIAGPLSITMADDGTIIFVRDSLILVRRPGELTESALAGASEVRPEAPVVSPRGADLVYAGFTGSGGGQRMTLRRASLRGGASSTLWTSGLSNEPVVPLAWGEDGWIYVATRTSTVTGSLGRLRENGGEIEPIVDGAFLEATLLPGGMALAGCVFTGSATSVVAIDLTSRTTIPVESNACSPRWSPTGHLLFSHTDGTLRALPFDPDRLEATGPSMLALSSVATVNLRARYQLNRAGALLYVAGAAVGAGDARFLFHLVGLDGLEVQLPLAPTDHPDAGFSPDGRRLAYTRGGQIWIYDLDLGGHDQFTRVGSEHHNPVWSPDNTRMAYGAFRSGNNGLDLYVQALTDDSVGSYLGGTAANDSPTQWLPDGTLLLNVDVPSDIATLHADRPGTPVPVLQADWNENNAVVSPDGRWLAYRSNEPGWPQLTVRRWPGLGQKVVIADSVQAQHHFWSSDGRTLYYVRGGSVMAASLGGTDSFRAESHRVVIGGLRGVVAAMHPDGRRFLVFRQAQGRAAPRQSLIIVTGWLTELRRKLAEAAPR